MRKKLILGLLFLALFMITMNFSGCNGGTKSFTITKTH